jgi:hypothetical protein
MGLKMLFSFILFITISELTGKTFLLDLKEDIFKDIKTYMNRKMIFEA